MKTVRRSKQIKALKYNTDMGLRATLSQVASVLSPKLSQVSSIFSPTPPMNIHRPVKRVQPKRNAKKKKDEDFVYSDVLSTSSLLIGSTLSDSQFVLSTPRCNLALDTQPVLEGNDSISFSETQMATVVPESQTETVIRETQTETVVPETHIETVVPETQIEYQNVSHTPSISGISPQSRHGSKMMSGLSSLYNYDTSFSLSPVSQSLLPVTHPDISYELSTQLSSTPIGSQYTTVTSPVVSRDSAVQTVDQQTVARATQTDNVHESEHQATQTSRDSSVQTVDQQTAARATQTDYVHELEQQATQTSRDSAVQTVDKQTAACATQTDYVHEMEHQAIQTSRDSTVQTVDQQTAACATQTDYLHKMAFIGHKKVQLFRGPKEPLSAFFHHPLRWRNRTYISAEQAYQFAKLMHHKAPVITQRKMLRCKTSHACKQLAYKFIGTSNASWDSIKYEVMEEICVAKYHQCKKFKEALGKSGDSYLLHNTETDSTWGCGSDLEGLNKMGHILMNVRQRQLDYDQEFPPLPGTSEGTVHRSLPAETTTPETTILETTTPVTPAPRKVVVIGNSNSRGFSQLLSKNGIVATGFVYPGQSAQQIVRWVKSINLPWQSPDAILVHVGDIEVRDLSLSVSTITTNIKRLMDAIRSESADTSIIISGIPQTTDIRLNRRIDNVNYTNSSLCRSMDNVYYVSNKTAALNRDHLHLTTEARDLLCSNIAYLVKQCI